MEYIHKGEQMPNAYSPADFSRAACIHTRTWAAALVPASGIRTCLGEKQVVDRRVSSLISDARAGSCQRWSEESTLAI